MADGLKIGVVGSRKFTDYRFLCDELDGCRWLWGDFTVVSGGAKGADTLAVRWANERGLPFLVFEAQWEDLSHPDALLKQRTDGTVYDVYAGFRRNQTIVDSSDKMVAFWDGISKGTASSVGRARKRGLPIYVFWPGREVRIINKR